MLTKAVTREKLSTFSVSIGIQEWWWRREIFQVQRRRLVQQVQQRWSCCESVSKWEIVGYGAWLSSYSRDIFFSRVCTPGGLYTRVRLYTPWGLYTLPRRWVRVVFGPFFSTQCIIVPVLELVVSVVGKHYILVSWLCILYQVVL